MHTRPPSPDWELRLQPFQSLFSKPGFRYFRAFVVVFAPLDGRRWVPQVILSKRWTRRPRKSPSGSLSHQVILSKRWTRPFTNWYRFLESTACSHTLLARQVGKRCEPSALAEGPRLLAASDETVAQKSGKPFESLGVHPDPRNKPPPKGLSRGHGFVCLTALAQQGIGHWVALLVSCALYVQKKVCQKGRKKVCQKGRPFATKWTRAADLLQDLPIPLAVGVVAVAEGASARKNLVRPVLALGRHVLSRLRSDTPFFDLPPARKKQKKGKLAPGRPPPSGKKYKAATWAAKRGTGRTVTFPL